MDVRGDKHKAQKASFLWGGGQLFVTFYMKTSCLITFFYEKYRFVTFLYTKGNDLNHFVQKSYFS